MMTCSIVLYVIVSFYVGRSVFVLVLLFRFETSFYYLSGRVGLAYSLATCSFF